MPAASNILTINAGSSSVKFAVFANGATPQRILTGQIERIGTSEARLTAKRTGSDEEHLAVPADTHQKAAQFIADYIQKKLNAGSIDAIGHRIVHGGLHLLDHQLITPDVLVELKKAQELDAAHLPREIALIEAFGNLFPGKPQIAAFDTAFHRDMPAMAQLLPIPRKYSDAGVRRFGFHGLSYTYLMQQLTAISPEMAGGRVILAHLGSGASMAAVHNHKPIDTTMAFTPLAGLVMGTRPGDLDPGFLLYLLRHEKLNPDQLDDFLNHKCGLLGVSGASADMRDLLAKSQNDSAAKQAVDLFCYQAKKQLAGLTSTLGGLDTLVFSGGIGEHVPEIRARICGGFGYLGIQLNPVENSNNSGIISADQSAVTVRVIPTNEEMVIAQIVNSLR